MGSSTGCHPFCAGFMTTGLTSIAIRFPSSNTAFALGACDLARLGGFLAARRREELGSNPARPAAPELDMIPIALRPGYKDRVAGLEHCDSLLAEIRSNPHRNTITTNSGKPAN